MVEAWEGDIKVKAALKDGRIKTQGSPKLADTMDKWLGMCLFADIRPADPMLKRVAAD
jgi:hypothetical protein